jgi:hypothetical protein
MATSTDVPIYTNTLASTATSVVIDISAFQNYKNLKIVYSAQNVGGTAVLGMRFNSDSGSNYSATYAYGTGSGVASGRDVNQTGMSAGDIPSSASGLFSANTIYINNYSNTNMNKTAVMRHNSPGVVTVMSSGVWRSTAAITSITFYGATFNTGSTFSVYGIGSATASTKATGGAIYSDADYIYHVFGSTGAFTPTQTLTADVLVVAGGGGGGGYDGGGGGAGGLLQFTSQSLTNGTSYTCTVGAGGARGTSASASGTGSQGGNSQFGSLTTAIGGMFGKAGGGTSVNYGSPLTGGSGGGGGSGVGSNQTSGTLGTSGQGYNGGNSPGASGTYNSGGGGGAGGAGASAVSGVSAGGAGGIGATSALINSIGNAIKLGDLSSGNWYLAGGGSGFYYDNAATTPTPGGLGGGGRGGVGLSTGYTSVWATDGKPMTGGGGGGGWVNGTENTGAAGGSGVVIVRYAK